MSRILSSGNEPSRKKFAASSVTRPVEEFTPSKAPLMETTSLAVKINQSFCESKLMVPDFGQPMTKSHDLLGYSRKYPHPPMDDTELGT